MIREEVLIALSFIGGLGLVVAVPLGIYNLMLRRAWRRAARELGFATRPSTWRVVPALEGRIGDARIRVNVRHLWGGWATSIEVTGLGRYPRDVEMTIRKAPTPGASMGESAFERHDVVRALARRSLAMLGLPDEIPTGDDAFDRAIAVRAEARRALALLGRDARRVVRECLRAPRRACLRTHESLAERIELDLLGIVGDSRILVDAVRDAMTVARAASLGARSVEQAIAENARDEVPGVRARCLDALVFDFPHQAPTTEACRAALADADADVRLAGARGLGREAHPVLENIVRDASIVESCRIAALELRLLDASPGDAGALLESLLADEDDALRSKVIAAVGSLRWRPALERLLAIADGLPEPDLVAIPRALGQFGDVRAQPVLMRWLAAGEGWGGTRSAIVQALGEVGNVEAVAALGPLTHEGLGSWYARHAIRQIQSRLGPIDAGRLSLHALDDTTGELSEASDSTGDLSVVDDSDGRISLEPSDDRKREGSP